VTIEVSSTDRRDGKALALFARCAEWQTGHTKDGRAFFAIPGSEPGLFHMADQRDCSCADRQRSRNICKHIRAVRFWLAAYATGAVAPKPRPGAIADDERYALTPAGAAYLVTLDHGPTPRAVQAERAYLRKLIEEQAAHAQQIRATGSRPHDHPVWSERAAYIGRLQASLPRMTLLITAP